MKLITSLLVSFVTIAFLTGCTTAKFLSYTGEQTEWPTSPGAMTETVDGVTVYHGLPSKPYNVLGQLDLTQNHKLAPGAIQKAATVAKEHGADAIIVLRQGEQLLGVSSSGSGSAQRWGNGMTTFETRSNSQAVYGETARVWLIKYK